jgi:hypothetical protein
MQAEFRSVELSWKNVFEAEVKWQRDISFYYKNRTWKECSKSVLQ